MPHRLFNDTFPFATIFEAIILGLGAGYKIGESIYLAISEQDWQRLLGPQGFTVGLILAVLVLWGNGVVREKKERKRREDEEKSREARHKESIGLQRENSEKLMAITVESIMAKGMMASAMNRLVDELEGRPCNLNKQSLPTVSFHSETK